MDNNKNPVAEQWRLSAKIDGRTKAKPSSNGSIPSSGFTLSPLITSSPQQPLDTSLAEIMKRKGFFAAISTIECPMDKLRLLIEEHRQEASRHLNEVDIQMQMRITHLEIDIETSKEKIAELKEKLKALDEYRESGDPDLQQMIRDKAQEEEDLQLLQAKLTDVRIKLGQAKSGIIDASLDEAEKQVKKALGIQKIIYDETYAINKKRYDDEKDYLKRLQESFQELYQYYKGRYNEINKHLGALDVDGISPVTTQVLTTIGSISFGAAGFFFSTFAGATGFGNQDMLYFILEGLANTANQPVSAWVKIGALLGLIALVTIVSIACNKLLGMIRERKLDKEEEKLQNQLKLHAGASKKTEDFQYKVSIRSNNWYAFWLQIIPALLIAGLLMLGVSKSLTAGLGQINSSSEGLIFGTFISISLAGLIYLYLIKIVEPRMVRKLETNPHENVNWIKANLELCVVLGTFVVFCICIITIPYTQDTDGIIPVGQRTRYAILLFIGISLVGGISFAYGTRSRGLIETNDYLERVLQRLTKYIAYCSSPETPDIYTDVPPEQGNLLQHVLRQLSFNATVNKSAVMIQKKKPNEQNSFQKLLDMLFKQNEEKEEPEKFNRVHNITVLEPWEEKYFPYIVDELKAVEFEYREKKARVQKREDSISDHKAAVKTKKHRHESQLVSCEENIRSNRALIETARHDGVTRRMEIEVKYVMIENNLRDGFHLGMWYRENNIGPHVDYFGRCLPSKPLLLINNTPANYDKI
jgi:hypothetical protein